MHKKITTLVVSNEHDYTTDLVCIELQKRDKKYFRLNRDAFSKLRVDFNINRGVLRIHTREDEIVIDSSLQSVYFRAPTYLRETFMKRFSTEEQLYNSQWMAFLRNLTFFEDAKWMNNPNDTYKAENKLFQLKAAAELGFRIPDTWVGNSDQVQFPNKSIAIKSLDTAIFTVDDREAFFYTNILTPQELSGYTIDLCPVVIQQNLTPKIDYRVTVICETIFAVKILLNDVGIEGDWRKHKETLSYVSCDLPSEVKMKCFALMERLNLRFAGIDLAFSDDDFFFIEINPTGEWAWLVDSAGQDIHNAISGAL